MVYPEARLSRGPRPPWADYYEQAPDPVWQTMLPAPSERPSIRALGLFL